MERHRTSVFALKRTYVMSPTRVVLAKSVEEIENKRVEFSRECKRVRKRLEVRDRQNADALSN